MSKSRRKKGSYVSFDQQRNAAKWRVSGFKANLEDFLNTHTSVLRPEEISACRSGIESLESTLREW